MKMAAAKKRRNGGSEIEGVKSNMRRHRRSALRRGGNQSGIASKRLACNIVTAK